MAAPDPVAHSGPDPSRWPTGRLLVTAARQVERAWNNRLRDEGVSHAGMVLLSSLLGGPLSQRALADSHHVTEQTIGRTVAHLEASGHLLRGRDPGDRRRRVVELTPAGRALLDHLSDSGERLTDDLLADAHVDLAGFRAALLGLIDRGAGGRPPTGPEPRDRRRADGPALPVGTQPSE